MAGLTAPSWLGSKPNFYLSEIKTAWSDKKYHLLSVATTEVEDSLMQAGRSLVFTDCYVSNVLVSENDALQLTT